MIDVFYAFKPKELAQKGQSTQAYGYTVHNMPLELFLTEIVE
jgi:hypothetical protein